METRVKTVGLTLGKFAPLHKGHQYLIEEARRQVDKLYVLVYEANETWIPLRIRANWIRKLYPDVIVLEGHDSPQSYGYTKDVIKEQDDYILSVMPEPITHFFSSEPYGMHVSLALGAKDIRVDMSRQRVPLSATLVRANPAKAFEYLHPIVAKDFVKKVVVLGAESTGKTTLVEALADQYKTTCMPEHGRDFWLKHNIDGKLSSNQMVELAREHRALEAQAFANSNGLFFTDTNAFTTLQFCRFYQQEVPLALKHMAEEDLERYDLQIVCDIDIPFVQDGTRQDEIVRKYFQGDLLAELRKKGRGYYVVRGNLRQRIAQVRTILENAN